MIFHPFPISVSSSHEKFASSHHQPALRSLSQFSQIPGPRPLPSPPVRSRSHPCIQTYKVCLDPQLGDLNTKKPGPRKVPKVRLRSARAQEVGRYLAKKKRVFRLFLIGGTRKQIETYRIQVDFIVFRFCFDLFMVFVHVLIWD